MTATLIPVRERVAPGASETRERRIPGLTTPVAGLYLRRTRSCVCETCEEGYTDPRTCPHGTWEWWISAANGYKAHALGFETKAGALAAVEQLGRHPIDWTAPLAWFREHEKDLHVRAARQAITDAWFADINQAGA